MKIVKVKGGLGNQMFQYSFALLLKQKTDEIVKLDMSSFQDLIKDPVRKPRLLKYSISLPLASEKDISKVCLLKHSGNMLSFKYRLKTLMEDKINSRYFREKNRAYISPQRILGYSYYDGYWQSWKYIDKVWKDVKNDFVPNYEINVETQKMISIVENSNSVFVGIRKGDYSAEKEHYGSFGNSYYQKAMDYISKRVNNPQFYVFSNDIPWVKKNIDFSDRNVVFREPEDIVDDFEDLLIMAACKHSIIINSTYHWWGARMNDNKNKIVVAPKRWFFDDKPIDIIPTNWVRL